VFVRLVLVLALACVVPAESLDVYYWSGGRGGEGLMGLIFGV